MAPEIAGLHYDEILDCRDTHKSLSLRPALTELGPERTEDASLESWLYLPCVPEYESHEVLQCASELAPFPPVVLPVASVESCIHDGISCFISWRRSPV